MRLEVTAPLGNQRPRRSRALFSAGGRIPLGGTAIGGFAAPPGAPPALDRPARSRVALKITIRKRLVTRAPFALLSLAFAATTSPAQAARFGVLGGFVPGTVGVTLPTNETWMMPPILDQGWMGGVTYVLGAPGPRFAFRLEGTFSRSSGDQSYTPSPGCGNPGGGGGFACPGGPASSTRYESLGASADMAVSIFGTPSRRSLYFLGGIGYYVVRSNVTTLNPALTGSATTLGAVGFNAGLGYRVSKLFFEARYTQSLNSVVVAWPGGRHDLITLPLTVGFWF